MKKYVSLDKRSKKAQKEYYSERRVTWGELNPVTRSVPSGKGYNRKKDKQEMRRADLKSGDGFEVSSFFMRSWGLTPVFFVKKAILGLKTIL